MSQNHYQDILDFHTKFGVPLAPTHTLLEGEALKFRLDFLQEELDELRKAHEEGNLDDAVDALIDLEVVLLGTGQFMGISKEAYEEHWEEVHTANMAKERCTDASQSKRGTSLDIFKPKNWAAPNHGPIIEKYSK
jgi:predicted HAD superfamily Cof-like phosphohydrolase